MCSPLFESLLYTHFSNRAGNWKARAGIIQRCTDVVDEVMVDRRKVIEGTEASLDAEPAVRAQFYSDEVLVGDLLDL